MKPPKDCHTMDEVRAEIDRLDEEVVDLLAARWGYVDRIWALKRLESSKADVPWRNKAVIERVRARAQQSGLPPEMAEALWRQIIGWGIQYQDERLRDDA